MTAATTVGYGPLQPVDGPPPEAPKYGLLQATNVAGSQVRLVVETQDRWGNGVDVWPYPQGGVETFDPALTGTSATPKGYGEDDLDRQVVAPFVTVFADICTVASMSAGGKLSPERFRARQVAVLGAVEGAGVEFELLNGAQVPANQHLADGVGNFPMGNTPTSVLNGLALLEMEVARSGRRGVIHMSPQLATFLSANYIVFDDGGLLHTVNGTTVIPGYGYVDGATPEGHTPPVAWEEWMYATGPVDIRRSDVFTVPDTLAEAIDRGTGGATEGRPNTFTYLVERYYLVDYDEVIKAAVLVDRCSTDCGTQPS